MRHRPFGTTGLELPEICFGTMRFASKERADDEASRTGKRALEEALERGVDFIHSSYEYGTRWAVGDVLATHPRRSQVRHAIKVNVPDWGDATFDKATFRTQIEDALRDLHAERIDIVQHLQRGRLDPAVAYQAAGEPQRVADFDQVIGPLTEAFAELHDEGLVGYLATFPYTVGYARTALASGAFTGVVAYFDVLETEMSALFPQMRERGMGFIGIRPFMGGLLTDRRIQRDALPADDPMRDPKWDRAYDQLAEAAPLIEDAKGDSSWTAFALRFSLADPIIASSVVSINSPTQLHEVLDAVEGELPDPELVAKLDAITQRFRERHGVVADKSGLPVY